MGTSRLVLVDILIAMAGVIDYPSTGTIFELGVPVAPEVLSPCRRSSGDVAAFDIGRLHEKTVQTYQL